MSLTAWMDLRGAVAQSPAATFSNVKLLLAGDARPLFDAGNVGVAIANIGGVVIDTGIKPSWAAGSFSTGASSSHNKRGSAVELGSNFQLGTTFCLDAQVYCSTSGARIFDTRPTASSTDGWVFAIQATTLDPFFQCNNAGTSLIASSGITANTWAHVRCTYDGTTLRLFVNGVIVGTLTASINITSGTHLSIGNSFQDLGIGFANQYLADLRIVKAQALTTANFARPTAAWPNNGNAIALQTAVTYANVVLRSTYDSTVADQSTYARTMTAAGNAQVDTSVKKFGAGSLLLDGTGDYVSTPDAAAFDFSTGDYQLQTWIRRNGSLGHGGNILSCYVDATHGYSFFYDNATNKVSWYHLGDTLGLTLDGAVPDVTFTHLGIGRKSGWLYGFMDGECRGFVANTTATNCNGALFVGRANNSITNQDMTGNIDDLQLVGGECQLYRAFTPPTAALPTS